MFYQVITVKQHPGHCKDFIITRGVAIKIKLDDISRRVKNLSRKICELSKLLFVTCGGSNASLLRLACRNLKKEKEKKRRRRRGSSKQPE